MNATRKFKSDELSEAKRNRIAASQGIASLSGRRWISLAGRIAEERLQRIERFHKRPSFAAAATSRSMRSCSRRTREGVTAPCVDDTVRENGSGGLGIIQRPEASRAAHLEDRVATREVGARGAHPEISGGAFGEGTAVVSASLQT